MIIWILTLFQTLASFPRTLSYGNCIWVSSVSPGNLAIRTSNQSGAGADLSAPNDLVGVKWVIYNFSLSMTFSGSCTLPLTVISSGEGHFFLPDILALPSSIQFLISHHRKWPWGSDMCWCGVSPGLSRAHLDQFSLPVREDISRGLWQDFW